jgi:hypothetical protein
MHPWVRESLQERTILDAIDSLRRSAGERRKAASPFARWLWNIEERRMARVEGEAGRTYGQVVVVSPQGALQNAEPVFFARVSVANSEGALRAGMQGRGKITTGWRPAGVVFFRRIGTWMWAKLWNWFGW